MNVVARTPAVPEPRPDLVAGARPTAIVPKSLDEAYRLAKAIVMSGTAPKGVSTPEACMIAIMHGLEIGLAPLTALQRISVINGRPTLWGDGAMSLVRGSGICEYINERIEGEGETQPQSARCSAAASPSRSSEPSASPTRSAPGCGARPAHGSNTRLGCWRCGRGGLRCATASRTCSAACTYARRSTRTNARAGPATMPSLQASATSRGSCRRQSSPSRARRSRRHPRRRSQSRRSRRMIGHLPSTAMKTTGRTPTSQKILSTSIEGAQPEVADERARLLEAAHEKAKQGSRKLRWWRARLTPEQEALIGDWSGLDELAKAADG
jgi:hypothetical protein